MRRSEALKESRELAVSRLHRILRVRLVNGIGGIHEDDTIAVAGAILDFVYAAIEARLHDGRRAKKARGK